MTYVFRFFLFDSHNFKKISLVASPLFSSASADIPGFVKLLEFIIHCCHIVSAFSIISAISNIISVKNIIHCQ